MKKKYDGKYVLKKPKDSDEYYRVYATADSADDLSPINTSNTEPVLIQKADYDSDLVKGSSRNVVTPTGKYLMCVYRLQARKKK